MNIAEFQREFARRSRMSVYERANEDAERRKARHRTRLAKLAVQNTVPTGVRPLRRASRYWWVSQALWLQPGGRDWSVLKRPTETAALARVFLDARLYKSNTALFKVLLREVLCEQAAERHMQLAFPAFA